MIDTGTRDNTSCILARMDAHKARIQALRQAWYKASREVLVVQDLIRAQGETPELLTRLDVACDADRQHASALLESNTP